MIIKDNGQSWDEVYDRATWRRIRNRASTPHKNGNKMKRENKINLGRMSFIISGL